MRDFGLKGTKGSLVFVLILFDMVCHCNFDMYVLYIYIEDEEFHYVAT